MIPRRRWISQAVHSEKLVLGLRHQCRPLCRGERDDDFGHVVLLILWIISLYQGLKLSGHTIGNIVPL